MHLVLHVGVSSGVASTDTGLKPLAGRTVQGLGFLECGETEGRVGGRGVAVSGALKQTVRAMQVGQTDEIPPVVVANDVSESDMMILWTMGGWCFERCGVDCAKCWRAEGGSWSKTGPGDALRLVGESTTWLYGKDDGKES